MKKFLSLNPLMSKRINAFTVDLFLVYVLKEITVKSFLESMKIFFFQFPFKFQYFLSTEFNIFSNITLLSVFFTYFTLFHFLTNGRTPGKYFLGLRLYTSNHELTLSQCIGKSFYNLFSVMLFCAPFFSTIFHRNNLGLGEFLTKTNVDYEKKIFSSDMDNSWQLSLLDLTDHNQNNQKSSNVLFPHFQKETDHLTQESIDKIEIKKDAA